MHWQLHMEDISQRRAPSNADRSVPGSVLGHSQKAIFAVPFDLFRKVSHMLPGIHPKL